MNKSYWVKKTPSFVSFSGGRTSGYMLHLLLEAYERKLPKDLLIVFANTGREDEATLVFVQDIENKWGVKIHWVEYRRNASKPAVFWKGKSPLIGRHDWVETCYAEASRNGEPFEQLIQSLADYRKEAKNKPPVLPNPVQRICSSELKIRTMDRFVQSKGFPRNGYGSFIGLRYDEPKRVSQLVSCNELKMCPLYDERIVEKDVHDFWKTQPFDLGLKHDPELGTYEGNCDLCFLKKTAKIKRLAAERPQELEWWSTQEKLTGATFRKDRFTYTDLLEGKVELPTVSCNDEDLGTCFCTD